MHRWWSVYFNLFWCLTSSPSAWLSGCSLFTTFPSAASILYVNKCLPSAPEIWDQELQRYCEILASSTLSALDKEDFRAYSKAYISIFLPFFITFTILPGILALWLLRQFYYFSQLFSSLLSHVSYNLYPPAIIPFITKSLLLDHGAFFWAPELKT